MTSFSRAERVSGLIQETLSDLLNKRIHDPRLHMATITRVKMSADLKSARIYYAIYGDDKRSQDAAKGFESARGFIKRILAPQLGLRYMPDLKFFYDDSFDYGSHIDQLLEKIKSDDGQNHHSH
ncbi:MAG: 30S ribosome-binding factor RbfA [Deltaproteobacteria bacterium]|jgi:ribosome-binding factor A|nr:30S ribosome-binding factor RbfA [Deltaproteobacteria bacterium]MBW2479346.1 30S ribosome-binding factor RbfA [Deltaproteobacteria bacterium]